MDRPWEGQTLVRIVQFRGGGGRGGTRPLLAQSDTGEVLHIKVQANPQSTMSLVNDWIGTSLGQALNVPCPEVRLVEVNLRDLKALPVLRGRRWRPGTQFGTVFVPECHSLPHAWSLEDMPQIYMEIPLIALFEIWLDNTDLKLSHILRYQSEGQWQLLVTDHGFIFPGGPRWTPDGLKRYEKDLRQPPVLDLLGAVAPQSFGPALTVLQTITRADLNSLMASLPRDWSLSKTRRESVVAFLMRRLDLMPRLAEQLSQRWRKIREAEPRRGA